MYSVQNRHITLVFKQTAVQTDDLHHMLSTFYMTNYEKCTVEPFHIKSNQVVDTSYALTSVKEHSC